MLLSLVLGMILMGRFIKGGSYFEIVLLHFLYNFLVILFNNRFIFPTDIFFISFWAHSQAEALFIGSLLLALPIVSLSMYLYFKKGTPIRSEK